MMLLTGCMPDSFTKFKEDAPTKKSSSGGSSGDSGGGPVADPVVPPTGFYVTAASLQHSKEAVTLENTSEAIDENTSVEKIFHMKVDSGLTSPIEFDWLSVNDAVDAKTDVDFVFSVTPDLPAGLTIDANTGNIDGTPTAYTKLARYTITYTQADIVGSTESLNIMISVANPLTQLTYGHVTGDRLILKMSTTGFDITDFSLNETISADITLDTLLLGGITPTATIDFIDVANNELHVTVVTGGSTFLPAQPIDNADPFVLSIGEIESVVYAFTNGVALGNNAPIYAPKIATGGSDEFDVYATFSVSPNFGYATAPTNNTRFLENSDNNQIETVNAAGLAKYLSSAGTGIDFYNEITATTGRFGTGIISGTHNAGTNLQPDDYVFTMQTQENNTVNTTLRMSFLDYAIPKALTNMKYKYPVGSKLVLTVGDVTPFSATSTDLNNWVSGPSNFRARVDAISGNRLFVTIDATTDDFYGIDTTGGFANIDNSENFFGAETQISDILYVVPVGSSLDAVPGTTYASTGHPNGFSAIINEKSSVSGTLSGEVDIAAGGLTITPSTTGSCAGSNPNCTTNFDKELTAGMLLHINGEITLITGVTSTVITVSPAITVPVPAGPFEYSVSEIEHGPNGLIAGASDERDTIVFSVSPDPASIAGLGLTFDSASGVFTGVTSATLELPETEFTITATNLRGSSVNTTIKLATANAPSGFALGRNYALQVPLGAAATSFTVGDYISSSGTGIGIVTGTFTDVTFDVVEVRLISGEFKNLEDIDNIKIFQAQKTYILDEGAKLYNTKLKMASTAAFTDEDADRYNWIGDVGTTWSGSTDRGYITYKVAAPTNDLPVGYYSQVLYVLADQSSSTTRGAFVTGETFFGQIGSCTTTCGGGGCFTQATCEADTGTWSSAIASSTIQDLESSHAQLTVVSVAAADIGDDLAQVGQSSRGTVHSTSGLTVNVDTLTDKWVHAGAFGNIDFANTNLGAGTTLSSVASLHEYYFYRGEEASLNPALGTSTSSQGVTYSIKGAGNEVLPTGLTFDTATGGISGTPVDPLTKTSFTITATNSFGATTYTFSLKVYDHYQVKLTSNANMDGAYSFNLHRGADGYSNQPCRVTKEQIDSGANNIDIDCFLDTGEQELWSKGMDITITSGDDMCQFIKVKDYSFVQWRVVNTFAGIAENTGSNEDALCTARYGAAITDQFPAFSGLAVPPTSSDHLCQAKYDRTLFGTDLEGPNCDEGEITVTPTNYDTSASACLDEACTACLTPPCGQYTTVAACLGDTGTWAPENGIKSQTQCEDNNGACAGEATPPQLTRVTCEGDGGIWTPTTNIYSPYCLATVGAATTQACGGDNDSCLSGAGVVSSQANLGYLTGINAKFNGTDIDITYGAPSSQTGPDGFALDSTMLLSNYTDKNNCIDTGTPNPYSYNYTGADTYSDATVVSTGRSGEPRNGGYSYYTYNCVDGASTIKARVRMHVRDWDQAFSVTDLIDQFDPGLALMDNAGNDGFGQPLDNYPDWDSYSSLASFSACGVPNTELFGGATIDITTGGITHNTSVDISALVTSGMAVVIDGNEYLVFSVSTTTITLASPALTTNATGAITMVQGYRFPMNNL